MKYYIALFFALFLFSGSVNAQSGPQYGDTTYIKKDIAVVKLSEHLYLYVCFNFSVPSNGVIYVDNNKALLVDAPDGENITGSLMNWIEDSLHAKIEAVLVTHWHAQDRMGGIRAVLDRKIASYTLEMTNQIADEKKLAHPVHTFVDSLALLIGTKTIICKYPGAGHTKDNTVVWFPEEKILFGGCLVKDAFAQNLGYTADADLAAWPVSVKNLYTMFPNAVTIIPGHFRYGGKELLGHTIDLLSKSSAK